MKILNRIFNFFKRKKDSLKLPATVDFFIENENPYKPHHVAVVVDKQSLILYFNGKQVFIKQYTDQKTNVHRQCISCNESFVTDQNSTEKLCINCRV